MRIGIKYCGGCNVQYDRTRQVEKLKQQFKGYEYTAADEPCDLLLAVCGCMRACPDLSMGKAKECRYIRTEHDFQKLFLELKKEKKEETSGKLTVLKKGQKAQMTKSFDREDVLCFAELTGDFSDLHVNEEFSQKQWFQKPVVHGVLVGSLISSVMGMELPGPGTILAREEIDFLKPVFYGDRITATVEFTGCEEERLWYTGEFTGKCLNQNGEIVAEAKVRQVMMKNLFKIEE
ncbi:MaoC family dehydratase [Anaerostipes sp.]|uniref:MaoC family dehydratase n=1 Tax=Anaerostipes sp. TaxID=1872530 RepID=UPI0025BCDB75|nr:MaoC family dehydratase [Anaerostipes sp.]MBS7009889.1 MaoC family dehydratase [Anaerostipes sp.]